MCAHMEYVGGHNTYADTMEIQTYMTTLYKAQQHSVGVL